MTYVFNSKPAGPLSQDILSLGGSSFLELTMKFEKPFLEIEQQVALLVQQGMGGDPQAIAQSLAVVNYHRLSAYWFPFQRPDRTFEPRTFFDDVWKRYAFDRQIRVLMIDAIERFEIALRTQLAYYHAKFHGPFAYAADRASRPKMKRENFPDFYQGLLEELTRSKEPFIKRFYDQYGDEHDVPPIWEAVEVMSFGSMVTLYKSTTHKMKQPVASIFGVPDAIMESWLLTLNTIRNACAHHSRLWDRELRVKPLIPRGQDYPDWQPVKIHNDRIFAVLTICQHCLTRIAPQSQWSRRLETLLKQSPLDLTQGMGFPEDWRDSPIWQNHSAAPAPSAPN